MNNYVREAIEDAVDAGLYVIVDWHIHNDPTMFTDEAKEFFAAIAEEYGHLPNIIYEICNEIEPESITWEVVKSYAFEVIPEIRQHDSDNIIIVGNPTWCVVVFRMLSCDCFPHHIYRFTLQLYDTASHAIRKRVVH